MSNVFSTLEKARAALILDHPFFASLILPVPLVEDETIKSASTDGDTIRFNPEWMAKWNLQETLFILAHEAMHIMFMHMCRRGDRNGNRWNIATDLVINGLLVKEGIGQMPPVGLLDDDTVKRGGHTAEGVYNILPEETEKKGAGEKGGALDDVKDAGSEHGEQPTDDAKLKQKEAEMRVKIVQARNAARMQGALSADLDRLIEDLIKVRTDWRSILRKFLTERAKTDYSYAKLKRRFLAEDILLPSQTGIKMGKISFYIDCSGSVNKEQLARFGSEVMAVCEDVRPQEVTVSYFDTRILHTDTFPEGELPTFKARGGGGTDFKPIFKNVKKMEEQPIAVVVLTDMYGDFPRKAPDVPVLWASVSEIDEAPFGEVIQIGDDD